MSDITPGCRERTNFMLWNVLSPAAKLADTLDCLKREIGAS